MKFYFVFLCCALFSISLHAQTTFGGGSYDDDPRPTPLNWQSGASWTSTNYPGNGTDGDGTLNLDGETLNFNHYMKLGTNTSAVNVDVATSNNAGGFNVNDVLIIYGNVTFANKAMPLNISGTLIIIGNLTINNQFTMSSSGTLVVSGSFTVNNGAQASYSGTGDVYAGSYGGDAQTTIDSGAGDGDSSFTIDELNDPTNGLTNTDFGTEIEEFVNGSGGTPLPIKLATFEAVQEKNSVNLIWKTTSEDNFSHFEIYRLTNDGAEIMSEVPSTLNANGDDYTLTDNQPSLGLNIYQIRSVDFDGYTEWFEPTTIVFQPQEVSFQLYPNAGTPSELKTDIYEPFTLEVFNISGEKLLTKKVIGKNLTFLSGLKEGNYIFRYDINGHLVTQRMIIR